MRSFWLGSLVSVLMLSGLWLVGIEQQLGVGTPSSRWIFDVYQHKIKAANSISAPRVLVVAGSNAMFGIDSSQLESYWQRPVINLGVNAGLGLPYILQISQRIARPGDVIVMPIEYALILDQGEPNAGLIDYVLSRDVDYWRSLSTLDRLRFAVGMAPERWVQGLEHYPDQAVRSGTYGAHHLDLRGDQTHSAPADRNPTNVAAVRTSKDWHYGARAEREKGGWRFLEAFQHWANANHICVIAMPTALLHFPQYDSDPVERAFYSGLPDRFRRIGIEYIGEPRHFMYPETWFFDTDHHLQDWSRKVHTERLIALLKPIPESHCSVSPAS